MNDTRSRRHGIFHALSLCARARKLIFGVPMLCDAMRGKQAPFLVLEASDVSENTHKRLCDKCSFYHVRLHRLDIDGETLARTVGKMAFLAAVGITDANMCKLIDTAIGGDICGER